MRQHLESILDDAKLSDALKVSSVECMGACDTPLALALQGTQRATYLFAGIDVKSDKDDIVATCRTYLDSPAGWIEDARPCGRLRLCLRARIPANDAD